MTKYYFIDLFCGAGGVTTGIHRAKFSGNPIAKVIACVNHDATAIASHEANHPGVLHYTEDIKTLDLSDLVILVNKIRVSEPDAIICLWASLECTNFSKAKGGLPRDADSRTLAEHLIESVDTFGKMTPRYIPLLKPDMIWIENVEEFMSWGPLDENGKPINKKAGADYLKWVGSVKKLGYNFDWKILNAADFGAYTSRKRFFAQFALPHIEIYWPQATHGKKPHNDVFGKTNKWKAVRDVLNLDETGESIFIPGRIKSDKTFERIYHGLIKFVAGGKKEFEAFLMKFNSTASNGDVKHCSASIENPAPTIDTQGRIRVINALFLSKYYSGRPADKNISLDGPSGTIRTCDGQILVSADFILNADVQNNCNAVGAHINKSFISAYYGNGHNCTDVNKPHPSLTTGDRFVLISPQFIYRDFTNGGSNLSINSPSGSIQANPKLNLITAEKFLLDTQFGNNAKSIDEPAPTQTSSRKHFYLMNPQWFNSGASSIDQPCFTIIARQDKAPAYMVCAESGYCAIEITDNDLPHALLIKAFMVMYGIVDVKMRMLEIIELLRIQGFINEQEPEYVLKGTKTKQKWMLGNAVECTQAQVLIEASYAGNFDKIIELEVA